MSNRPRRQNAIQYYAEDDICLRSLQHAALFSAPVASESPPSSEDEESSIEEVSEDSSTESEGTDSDDDSEDEWKEEAVPLNVRRFGGAQKIQRIIKITESPHSVFYHFLPQWAFVKLAKHTNEYARHKNTPGWRDTSVYELKKFIAGIIYMGLVKIGAVPDYWSKELAQPFMAKIFTRDRFCVLMTRLHSAPPGAA